MKMVTYKQQCIVCRKSYVLMQSRRQKPVCLDCEMKHLFEPIEDPEMKKLFDIPKELYKESHFLRDIRRKYNMLGFITERQGEAFEKAVKDLQDPKKKAEWEAKKKEKEAKKKTKKDLRLTPEEKKMLGLE